MNLGNHVYREWQVNKHKIISCYFRSSVRLRCHSVRTNKQSGIMSYTCFFSAGSLTINCPFGPQANDQKALPTHPSVRGWLPTCWFLGRILGSNSLYLLCILTQRFICCLRLWSSSTKCISLQTCTWSWPKTSSMKKDRSCSRNLQFFYKWHIGNCLK